MHNHHHPLLSPARLPRLKKTSFFWVEEGKGDGLKWCPHKMISAHMLGHVHGGQPTVILRVPAQSQRKVNAWICAPRKPDHHPANVNFIKICNICNVSNVCNLRQTYCFSVKFHICNCNHFIQDGRTRKIGPWICSFDSRKHLALLTVDAVKSWGRWGA